MWLLTVSFVKAAEWLYFQKGHARATVFIGSASARTFDFQAGDTAVFPDNAGTAYLIPFHSLS